mmetsp:Transcript_174720/g.560376  ORF Transcript_174720/g.560376 Transcript_174720/m.560376 type:complete len:313 (-) Transcript_174720:1818-2756(-)
MKRAALSEVAHGVVHGLKSLCLVVDECALDALRRAHAPAQCAPWVVGRHHQSDLVLVVLADVIANLHAERSPIVQKNDLGAILVDKLWKALPDIDDVELVDLPGCDKVLNHSLPVHTVDQDIGSDARAHRSLPRAVDVLDGQVPQLRHPAPHEVPLWVHLLPCKHRVHHEVPGTYTRMAAHLPHHGVDGHIGVDQRVVVPGEAVLPTAVQMLDEKLCGDVPQVVAHPADFPELPHGCIDQRKACLASLPALQRQPRAAPLLVLVVRPDADSVGLRPAIELGIRLVPPHDALREEPPQLIGQGLPAAGADVAR